MLTSVILEQNVLQKWNILFCGLYKDSEKLLVIHNFGNSEIEIPLTDRTEKAIAVSGNVQEKEDHGNFYLKLDGYASVVYLLKN